MKNNFQTLAHAAVFVMAFSGSPYIVPVQADGPKPLSIKSVTPDPELTKAFHTNSRWCGADGACSVPLDEDTTVWLFGDTFVRKENSKRRQSANSIQSNKPVQSANSIQSNKSVQSSNSSQPTKSKENSANDFAFINNTVSVQKLSNGEMKFYWRNIEGSPLAVMAPKSVDKTYYWPGDGFVLDEKLFVVNKVIASKPIKKEGDFGFDWKGDDLVQVSNAGSDPTTWKWKSAALPDRQGIALMGTALLLKGDYAYFYMSLKKDARGMQVHPTGVARISKRSLLSMDMSKFEYWNGQKWVPDIAQASILFEDGTSEMTVTELEGEPYLVATYMAPMSADITMRFAKQPEGPWSDPIKVYQCLEHQTTVLGRKVAVYSAKAHPEFSKSKNEVVVSYCCNPGEMKHYLERPDMYYPRIIRVRLAK